jgi:DNA-binding beta-propeller fold protein YncE
LNGSVFFHRSIIAISSLIALAIGIVACGSSLATNSRVSPTPRVLIGRGTTWQIVARDAANGITGLALDGQGHVYASEVDSDRIAEFTLDGRLVRAWGAHGSGPGQLDGPAKLALDKTGNVWVTEVNNNRVQEFSPSGTPLMRWGGGDASSAPGRFNFPVGIAIDQRGEFFIADTYNHRIQKLTPAGAPIAQWKEQSPNGDSIEPYDVAADAAGDVYATDLIKDRVVELSPTGTWIRQIGHTGSAPAEFSSPAGVSIDSSGNLFVDDPGNNRIEELSANGVFMSEWAGPSDVPFDPHTEMALDANGHVYVSLGSLVLRTCLLRTGCQQP